MVTCRKTNLFYHVSQLHIVIIGLHRFDETIICVHVVTTCGIPRRRKENNALYRATCTKNAYKQKYILVAKIHGLKLNVAEVVAGNKGAVYYIFFAEANSAVYIACYPLLLALAAQQHLARLLSHWISCKQEACYTRVCNFIK